MKQLRKKFMPDKLNMQNKMEPQIARYALWAMITNRTKIWKINEMEADHVTA